MTLAPEFTAITSPEELRELLGAPMRRAIDKERVTLHAWDREWLARTPLCLISTSDADGNCDVSPKGDPPGFVHVIDDTTIAIPDRPGNRRADGFMNVLSNPHVGLIFLIPGRGETLRINGRATLVREAPFFDEMIVKGNRPALALIVDIEQIFFHCAKALMRSKVWKPETWDPQALPSHARIVKDVQYTEENLEQLEEYYAERNYSKKLYGG
ncbi:pyridoxamine 5'-phosphate oxidase family protein [Actinomadura bangladeshensis]|jgi:PPOX class probable FMN-dependent enzyme|uniref:Pyridoxamine 5'-phosphate oxidase family protein n=1 Tax=Actinomadura bangladeshensis TaxID=453573 RepID=A0A6L9QHW7_9ACTN|nr:pyridoxamine 5'-phosphate oxidase family protein [Actinomadura bangladeshensis]NEA24273.1 pyridoxamine 5'-phosphate oxidase family protein [Actinomadura bangladeshensis]